MPEYNHEAYSNNFTHILNNGIFHVDIFKIVPLFKGKFYLAPPGAMISP
jgi:hypothetical protein